LRGGREGERTWKRKKGKGREGRGEMERREGKGCPPLTLSPRSASERCFELALVSAVKNLSVQV